jgi:hypothetical protein
MFIKRALGLVFCGALVVLPAACKQGSGDIKVDKVEPPQGTTGGGEEVTILGDGFGQAPATVSFGGTPATVVTMVPPTKIRAVTPVGSKGPVDVTVGFDNGRSFKIANGFRYVEPVENQNARNAFFQGNKPAAGKIELEKK